MAYRKLNRASGNRKALFRSLSSALIMNGRIETTITKAKETSKNVAKLITLAKVGDLVVAMQPKWRLLNFCKSFNTKLLT